MHILLTDILTCPRCGPEHGLIVLADRLEDRRVMGGRLGCPNCRESYRVEGGVADLRHASVADLEAIESPSDAADRAFRTAALIGVQGGNAPVLLIEPGGEVAAAVAEMVPDVHVLGLSGGEAPPEQPERGVLSRLRAGARLPVRSRSLRGAAALGIKVEPLLDDIHRVMLPGARLVVDPAPAGLAESLALAGFTVLLEQDGVVVAAISEPG